MADYGCGCTAPLTVMASRGTLHRMSSMLNSTGFDGDLLTLETQEQLNTAVQPLQAGESRTVGMYHITAVQANHDNGAESFLYAIESGDDAVLYATDTDTLPTSSRNQLSALGLRYSVVLDHTYGPGCDGGGHLNADRFRATMSWLSDADLLQNEARIYATHLSHEGNAVHKELDAYARQHGYRVPWDGLTVTV